MEVQYGGYYHFEFDELRENISWNSIDLEIDGMIWESDTAQGKPYPPLFFELEAIQLEQLAIWPLVWNDKIKIKNIHLKHGEVFFEKEGAFKAKEHHRKHLQVKDVKLGALAWEGVDFTFKQKETHLEIDNFHFEIRDVKCPLNRPDPAAHFRYSYFDVALDSLYFKNKGLYQYALKGMDLRPDEAKLSIEAVYILTHQEAKNIADHNPYQQSIWNIVFRDIALNDIDLHQWIKAQQFKAESLTIGDGYMYMYRDNSKTFFSKPRPYFQDLIWNIPIPLFIKEVDVNIAEYLVDLMSPKERRTHLNLTQMKVHLKDFSNFGEQWMKLDFYFNIFGNVPFEAHTSFSPQKGVYQHRFKGSMGRMDMRKWNDFSYAMAGIEIKQGQQRAMSFDFNCDHKGLKGKMNLLYNGLKLRVIKGEAHKEDKFLSALSGLAIHHDHPKKGHEVKPVEVTFQTHPDRFHIHLWINAIVQGFENAMLNIHLDSDKKYKKEQKKQAHQAKKEARHEAHLSRHEKHQMEKEKKRRAHHKNHNK